MYYLRHMKSNTFHGPCTKAHVIKRLNEYPGAYKVYKLREVQPIKEIVSTEQVTGIEE